MSQPLSLYDTISHIAQAKLESLRTLVPGVIDAFDTTSGTVSVRVMIKEPFNDGEDNLIYSELPVISGVPVVGMLSSSGGFTVPILPGDGCLILFSDRSIDEWMAGGRSAVSPQETHMHHLTDALCIVGLKQNLGKISDTHVAMTWKDDDGQSVKVNSSEVLVGKGASEFTVLGETFNSQTSQAMDKIAQALNSVNNVVNIMLTAMTAGAAITPPLGSAQASAIPDLSTLTQCAIDISTFSAKAAERISSTVKVK